MIAMNEAFDLLLLINGTAGIALLITGTLAYVLRSRELRRQGLKPPSFLKYILNTGPLPNQVRVPRSVRVVLGLVVLAGGTFFVLVGVMVLSDHQIWNRIQNPLVWGLFVLVFFVGLGAAMGYVGFRLIVVKDRENLFKSSGGSEAP